MPLDRRQAYTLDTDSAPEAVENGRAQALRNVQPERGYLRGLRGTQALPPVNLPGGRNRALAAVELPGTGGGVAWLVWHEAGQHSVVRQLPGQYPELLLTWPGLNLPAPGPATYLALVVLDTFLLYLDADGEVRSLPLPRLAAGEYPADRLNAEPYCLHLLKVPPPSQPVVARVAGAGDLAALRLVPQQAWQFAYRWLYQDGEQSVLSPFSAWLDVTEAPATSLLTAITVGLPVAPRGVRQVDVLVRTPTDVGWRVADSLRRTTAGSLASSYTFYGITQGDVVAGDDATRLFDYLWPSKALAAARNRLWYGRPTVGYPTPEPAFTVEVVSGAAMQQGTADVYELRLTFADGSTGYAFYTLAGGSYPSPASTYVQVSGRVDDTAYQLSPDGQVFSYQAAFVDPYPGEASPPVRTLTVRSARTITSLRASTQTLHENTTYRVAVRFYDALGRTTGVSQARTVRVPAQDLTNLQNRELRVTLTTTDLAALQAEIPAWATTYQFLVATNDVASEFRQGLAADALAYLGNEITPHADGTTTEKALLKPAPTAHDKLWVDIGNWPPAGQGYVFQPGSGDVLRFLEEDGQPAFPITGQFGDYVEVQWSGYPVRGNRGRRIEIYTPRTTTANQFYERGPRLAILRQGTQRRYGQASVVLDGDCYLAHLTFPVLAYDPNEPGLYVPPTNKTWVVNQAGSIVVESMVPQYRLVRSFTKTTINLEDALKSIQVFASQYGLTTSSTADAPASLGVALRWLDMADGGRPGSQIPLALQQVTLLDGFGFSGARLAGSLLNGLSAWRAEDQRELAREQGPIMALASADDVQSEDQVLLALCETGVSSIGVGIARVRQGDGGSFSADTTQVVGYVSAKKGGYGTRHPASLAARAGHLYWWSQDRAEVCRYALDGVNGLCLEHQCRVLGQELAAAYGAATVTAGYDLFSEEYVLAFGADETSGAPARTVRFSERAKGFVGDSDLVPEALVGTVSGRLLSFAQGQGWEHLEGGPRNTFYGVAYPARASVWANQGGSVDKTWLALRVESTPLWELVEASTPSGQRTRLPAGRMKQLDSVWHGALLRDETSPGFTEPDAARRALYEGVPCTGVALLLTLACADVSAQARLLAVGVEYVVNGGQSAP